LSDTYRLLLCDDDIVDRMAVIRELKGCNVEFVECSSAKQAFESLTLGEYDCVLLDYRMPDTDGLSALKHIMQEQLTTAPIIILSGLEDETLAVECLTFGAQDYILKSALKKETLLRCIRYAQERKQLERQLQTALADAQAANHAKVEFLANISYVLRTPLTSIIGFLARVLKNAQSLLGEKNYFAIKTAYENAEHLLELISAIQDLSKIETGEMKLNLTAMDICGSLRDLQRVMAPIAEKNNTEILLDLPVDDVLVKVDPVKIAQIVSNLVSNAIKFTHNGTVTLGLSLTEIDEQQGTLSLKISDTGIGISEEEQKKLSHYFAQSTHNFVNLGQGTGLVMVKEYVQIHGGNVLVSSNLGEGSIFTVNIPTSLEFGTINTATP